MVYEFAPLDLASLFGPVTDATSALVRVDERLLRSPVREGWTLRQHFADAAAVLWLEGELVHVEDLVLHDAHMDNRMPTHELTRAHAVLRARRQLSGNVPGWALSTEGLRALTRRGGDEAGSWGQGRPAANPAAGADEGVAPELKSAAGDAFAKALVAMDAVLEHSDKVLDGDVAGPRPGRVRPAERPELVYDPDWDEEARLAAWQNVVAETVSLPAVLRAAILIDAWGQIEVLQHASWLGPLLVADLLRQEGLAAHHLLSWAVGARQIPRERRRASDRTQRLIAFIDAITQATRFGLKEHDRLVQARGLLERRLTGKRRNSRLPELMELALSRPLITAPLVAKELKVSLQGALNLIGELGLREVTGRGRFRAWVCSTPT